MMKTMIRKLFCLLFSLCLFAGLFPAASAAAAEGEGLLDDAYLTEWMDTYIRSQDLAHNWQDFSVGFCYTATGDAWYYNADVFMYSASLYKVPVSMLMAEKEAAGELSQSDSVLGYSLEYLETSALVYSNNDSGHAMVSYLGGTYQGKCSDMCIQYTDLEQSYFVKDFFDFSYYSARFMTQVMTTLYMGGEERFPHVIEHLLQAQPDAYMNITMKGRWSVAQKYGAYEENNGNNNNHIAAIIYTPTPIVVVVMTRNVGSYQDHMAAVGAFLAKYALELDEKMAERAQQQTETEPLPVELDAAGETEPAHTDVPDAISTPNEAEVQAPTQEESALPQTSEAEEEATPFSGELQAENQAARMKSVFVLAALVLLLVVLVAVYAIRARARRRLVTRRR